MTLIAVALSNRRSSIPTTYEPQVDGKEKQIEGGRKREREGLKVKKNSV